MSKGKNKSTPKKSVKLPSEKTLEMGSKKSDKDRPPRMGKK